jgi:hypothetical protein
MVVESLIQDTGAGPYTLTGAISAFTSFLSVLPLQQLIRLAWIVGGYILLRPYLELGFRKLFATQAEHDSDTVAAVTKETQSPKSPRGLRPVVLGLQLDVQPGVLQQEIDRRGSYRPGKRSKRDWQRNVTWMA